MQEPPKLSPLQAMEANVSKVDCSKKTSPIIRNFTLGDLDFQDCTRSQDRSEETIKQEDYLQRIIEESCEASFKKVFSLRGVETQIIGGTTKYCGSGEVRLPRRGG